MKTAESLPDEAAALGNPGGTRLAGWLRRNSGIITLVSVLLLIWYAVIPRFVPGYIFPTIPTVLQKLTVILGTKSTYLQIGDTLERIFGGFAISAVIGVALGIALAMSRILSATLMPAVKFIMGMPALTWVLLSIIWFRFPEVRVWFLMIVLITPIVTVNTYDGVRATPHELYQMVRSLRPNTWHLLRMVVVPAATPFIFSGLKVGLSFGGRFVVFAEAMTADRGIGAAMYTLNQTFDTAGIIVWTLILVTLLSLLDAGLGRLERRWFRWRRNFQG